MATREPSDPLGLKNSRDRSEPVYCMECHPQMNGSGAGMLDGLERLL